MRQIHRQAQARPESPMRKSVLSRWKGSRETARSCRELSLMLIRRQNVCCGHAIIKRAYTRGSKERRQVSHTCILSEDLIRKIVPYYARGRCLCNDPIVNAIGNMVMDSLVELGKSIEKVWCPTLQALDVIVEVGSSALPGVGKAITTGMSKSWEQATF